MKIPKKLNRVPILEATAEIWFRSNTPSAADILLGTIFPKFRSELPNVARLPWADIPSQARDADPNLQRVSLHRLNGPTKAISIGERVISVSIQEPYPGWDEFKDYIQRVLLTAKDCGVVDLVERMSLKYINVLEAPLGENHLGMSRAEIKLADFPIDKAPIQLRTEIASGLMVAVVQLGSQATATLPNRSTKNGLVVDIDVIHTGPLNNFWEVMPNLLEKVHSFEKDVFFGLIKEDIIKRYEPIY